MSAMHPDEFQKIVDEVRGVEGAARLDRARIETRIKQLKREIGRQECLEGSARGRLRYVGAATSGRGFDDRQAHEAVVRRVGREVPQMRLFLRELTARLAALPPERVADFDDDAIVAAIRGPDRRS